MLNFDTQQEINIKIESAICNDSGLLDALRKEIQILKHNVSRIQPRTTTSIALVGTDGGNNKFQFDPFFVQIIRVVDSSNNELFLNVITTETNLHTLSQSHFTNEGLPKDALGEMMYELGINHLSNLSHMFKTDHTGKATNSGWVNDYRQIIEWAVLYKLVTKKDYGTDVIIIFDGLFRTKVFWPGIFTQIRNKLFNSIQKHYEKNKRTIYLAGIAKHSQVLTRYRLAMMLENILYTQYPSYVEVPSNIEKSTYKWKEFASLSEEDILQGKDNDFVGGNLFFVKFGPKPLDPIWAVDIFSPQKNEAQKILGFLLADANNGFPVPYYPMSLQQAHNNAALVDFDYDLLQGHIYNSIRKILGENSSILDIFKLMDHDPSAKRY